MNPKRFLRKKFVATRYSISQRTVDRWVKVGLLPSPHYFGIIPIWAEDELDVIDATASHSRSEPVAPVACVICGAEVTKPRRIYCSVSCLNRDKQAKRNEWNRKRSAVISAVKELNLINLKDI